MRSEGPSAVDLLDLIDEASTPNGYRLVDVGGYPKGELRVVAIRQDVILAARFLPEANQDA